MIQINDKKNCCGCGACSNICPKNCINMKYDEEGFTYPDIDSTNCVNCGLCEKVCPISNYSKPKNSLQEAAIVQNRDKTVLQESTSGGFFSVIAEYVIEKGGVVFGVSIDEEYKVKHIYVDSKNELCRFRNSKYVQSDVGTSFVDVKKFLEEGRIVCFSGTPCQVYALTKYLGKDYQNLILVDVVCRAVPSPGVWNRYIKMKEKKLGSLSIIRFRDKKLGYQYSTMYISSKSGEERGGIESDQWLRMFFSGMTIRPSCSACVFRSPKRVSDFTIWDCFNIHRLDKSFDEDKGTTRVLIHSKKGSLVFDEIKEHFQYKVVSYEIAIEGCKEFESSPQLHYERSEFFSDYNHMDFDDLLNKYYPTTIKIKIMKLARLILNRLGLDKTLKHMLKKG